MTIYEKWLKEWTKRLGLTDWRIKLHAQCMPDDMPSADSSGETVFTEATKCAVIYIRDPQCWGDRIIPFDGEEILVHELLHLKLALIQDVKDDLQERYVHQLLDDLARALVDARRADGNVL